MNNKPSKRISGVQKDILFILYAYAERQSVSGPLSGMKLLSIINQGRLNSVADTNFRRSCHTLAQHGLLNKYRDRQSLMLAFDLTAAGREKALGIYEARLAEIAQ